MLSRISIRIRLTLMSVALLTLCCVSLTLLLNTSADRIVKKIDASVMTPAQETQDTGHDRVSSPKLKSDAVQNTPTIEARDTFRTESIVYMIMMIVGGGALTYYISGRALRPLKMLNTQVKSIQVHNLSDSLVVPPTRDEIAELTQSFNEMTDKLDHAFQLQQQFSASAAHELKTPLSVLQAKVDVFRMQSNHHTEDYEALISIFEKQIHRLRGLVTNLLNMTQADCVEDKSDINLQDVFTDIFEELTPIAQEKYVTLSLQCDDSVVFGNLDSLYRAFYNIVENSIKYNVVNGKVTVITKQKSENMVSIQIADTGIGIPSDCKNDIFEPFFRVDKSRSRAMGGSGLGLAIVDRIIKQHGGTIRATDNIGGGTCFEIVLSR